MREKKPSLAWGRCPDCGAAVEVEIRKPRPGRILPHGCPARACEYPACRVIELQERMFRHEDGTWYCPRHGLVVAARALVALHRAEGDADWSAMSEMIGETLPEILRRIDAMESSSGRLEATP
jgi:ssDNA-binding Zn-finger/Zn-ribbon topoisomerase 1